VLQHSALVAQRQLGRRLRERGGHRRPAEGGATGYLRCAARRIKRGFDAVSESLGLFVAGQTDDDVVMPTARAPDGQSAFAKGAVELGAWRA